MLTEWNNLDVYDKCEKINDICDGLLFNIVIPNIQKLSLGGKLSEQSLDELKQPIDFIKECKILCDNFANTQDPDLYAIQDKAKTRLSDLENLLLAFGV